MLSHALAYADIGWAVFPVRPNAKTPATTHGVLDATTDQQQITDWWTTSPDCNIGLACGEPSGVVAIDIDPRHGGHHFFEAALDDRGPLPDGFFESQTGGGGTHYIFKFDGEKSIDIAPGVEVKSTGKYIVLPPSIHPNGKSYEWELSSSPLSKDNGNTTDTTDATDTTDTTDTTDVAGANDSQTRDAAAIFGIPGAAQKWKHTI